MKAKRSKQLSKTTEQVLKISNQIEILYELARQSKNNKTLTNSFGQKLRTTATMLQKKVKTLIKGAKQHDHENYDNYVIDFYENRCKMLENQIQSQKSQNIILKEKLDNYSKNSKFYDCNPEQQQLNTQQTILKFTDVFNTHTQKMHTIGLLQTQTNFTKEQYQIIENLKKYIIKIQKQQQHNRRKSEQKISQLNSLIDNHHKNFQKKTSEIGKQTEIMMKQIRQLEISNLKHIQQKSIMDQEIAIRNEKIRLLQRKLYDISIEALQIQNNYTKISTSNVQTQQIIKLLQAENLMLRKKMETNKCDYAQKLKEKNSQLNNLQQQIKEMIFENKKFNKQNSNVQKIKDNYENQLEKFKRQIESNNKAIQSSHERIEHLQCQNYRIKNQLKDYEYKCEKQAKMLKQTIQQLRKHQKKIHILEETISQHKYLQNQKQNSLKKDISEEISQLIKINKKLQMHNQQLSIQLQDLRIKNGESKTIIDNLTNQLQKANNETAFFKQKNKKLQYANKMLNQKMNSIQEEFELFCQCPSSDDVRLNLEHQLLASDRQLKTRQQQIEKLFKQNQSLKEKNQTLLKTIEQIKFNTDKKLSIHDQLAKKEFESRQLKQKVKILQQQIRQQENIRKERERQMQDKIQELENILKEGFSSLTSQQEIHQ